MLVRLVSGLRSAWDRYCYVVGLEWLDRLGRIAPRLAECIASTVLAAMLGLGAWYYLNPRFVLHDRRGFELGWPGRYLIGGLLAVGAVAVVAVNVYTTRKGYFLWVSGPMGRRRRQRTWPRDR